jgi:hypothetical protein
MEAGFRIVLLMGAMALGPACNSSDASTDAGSCPQDVPCGCSCPSGEDGGVCDPPSSARLDDPIRCRRRSIVSQQLSADGVYLGSVPSAALARWNALAVPALDQIEAAHRAVGGAGRGRRYATLQVNHAYAMLLSSQFQGFCRDLHSEAVAILVGSIAPAVVRPIVRAALVQGRKLDHGNPNPGNLGSDFGRLNPHLGPRRRDRHVARGIPATGRSRRDAPPAPPLAQARDALDPERFLGK